MRSFIFIFNSSAGLLINKLVSGSLNTGETKETSFLYQRAAVLVQRFNAILLHDTDTEYHTYFFPFLTVKLTREYI